MACRFMSLRAASAWSGGREHGQAYLGPPQGDSRRAAASKDARCAREDEVHIRAQAKRRHRTRAFRGHSAGRKGDSLVTQGSNIGWVSNGPVQFNVAGDVNIHGGCTQVEMPDDCVLTRASSARKVATTARRVWTAAKIFASALWFLARVMFWFGLALLVLAPLVAAMLLSICIWLLGRGAEQLLWIECKLGGGPTQLAYVPMLDRSARPAQLKVRADSRVLDTTRPNLTRGNEAAGRNPLRAPATPAQLGVRSTVSK